MKKSVFLFAIAIAFGSPKGLVAGDESSKDVIGSEIPIEVADDGWEFTIAPYGLVPWVDLTTLGGTRIDVGPDTVFDSLNMAAMFELGIRKDKWSLTADVINVDLDFDLRELTPLSVLNNMEVKEWLVQPVLGYRLGEGDWGHFEIQGGASMYWIDLTLRGSLFGGRRPVVESGSGYVWDAIVGFKGRFILNDQWHVGYSALIGGGDSDLMADGFVELGYRIHQNADLYAGFRYLEYQFGEGVPLDEQTVWGPQVGLVIRF